MRKDGKKIKDIDPIFRMMPYIMKKRYDAMNMITLDIPVEPMRRYINAKRKEGFHFTYLGIVVSALVRIMYEFPKMNRFIVNKRVYDRNGVSIAMVVLKPETGEESISKMCFGRNDTIFDVHKNIDEYISSNRSVETENSTDRLMNLILKVPGVTPLAVFLIKAMDKFGLLPNALIKASPFHSSALISNLASIRTNHIYHHIYDFGTTSITATIGNMREVPRTVKGEIVLKKCLPLGVVLDDRICGGSDFAVAFSSYKTYLNSPELLEVPLDEGAKAESIV